MNRSSVRVRLVAYFQQIEAPIDSSVPAVSVWVERPEDRGDHGLAADLRIRIQVSQFATCYHYAADLRFESGGHVCDIDTYISTAPDQSPAKRLRASSSLKDADQTIMVCCFAKSIESQDVPLPNLSLTPDLMLP